MDLLASQIFGDLFKKQCWCHFNLAKWEISFDPQEDVHVHVHPQGINGYSHEINL